MRLVFLLVLFQISVFQLYSQKMFDEKLSGCALKFILEDTDMYINYEPDDSIMIVDFLSGLEEKYEKRLQGVVMMQVMVDTANQVCCVSYTNKTTLSNKRLKVPDRLMNMPGWKRQPNVLAEKNICALVSILFDKKEVTVIRTGYNRNKGRKTMQSTTFMRYVVPKPIPKIESDSLPKVDSVIEAM